MFMHARKLIWGCRLCKMVAILSRLHCVDTKSAGDHITSRNYIRGFDRLPPEAPTSQVPGTVVLPLLRSEAWYQTRNSCGFRKLPYTITMRLCHAALLRLSPPPLCESPHRLKNSKWYPITYGCISEAKTWLFPLNNVLLFIYHGPFVRYVKSPGMPGAFSRPPWVSDPDMHHGTCVTHVPCCMSGALTNDFLWSWWRGKRSRHSRRMHKPQVHVSGKRPIPLEYITWSKERNGVLSVYRLSFRILMCSILYQHMRLQPQGCQSFPDSKIHGANMGPIWGR